MPAKEICNNRLLTIFNFFLVPVNCPAKANGILPYFNENVTTTVLSLNMTVTSLTV